MAGVGPMIAGAPTNHVDQLSIGQPIDITHYAQWGQSMDGPMVDPGSYGPPPPPLVSVLRFFFSSNFLDFFAILFKCDVSSMRKIVFFQLGVGAEMVVYSTLSFSLHIV